MNLYRRLCGNIAISWRTATLLMFIAAAFLHPASSPLFSDDFSSEAESNLNWVVVAENDTPLQFQQGRAALENNSGTYVAFAMHALRQKPAAISFSGRMLTDLPGSGLFYCTGKEGGVYSGYAVIFSDKALVLLEYGAQGEMELLSHDCPFLHPVNNNLTISGDNQRLRVFCNGYFRFSFPNSLGGAGDVAILAPPLSSVSFDDVSVADTIVDTVRFPPFHDALNPASQWGWSMTGNGTFERTAEGLRVITNTSQTRYGHIVVPVADFHMSVVLRHAGGSSRRAFGFISLAYAGDKNDSIVPSHRFGITAGGGYKIDKWKSADSASTIAEGTVSGYVDREWDTLMLSRHDSVFSFSINDDTIARIGDTRSVLAGAGLFVAESLSVIFRDFHLYDQCDDPVRLRPVVHQPMIVRHYASGTAFDLLGRMMGNPSDRLFNQRGCAQQMTVFRGRLYSVPLHVGIPTHFD